MGSKVREPLMGGDLRLNLYNRPIRLITLRPYRVPDKYGNWRKGKRWYVEDIASGEAYELAPDRIGRRISEMEVIAWAAK